MSPDSTASEPLRVVLVGCGGITKAWMPYATARPDLQFVGVVDIVPDAAARLCELYQLDAALSGRDVDEVLERTKPDIVFDCTIPEAHTDVTLKALAHGCHVLGEKPMALSLDDGARMIEAAQQAGKIYAVIQNRRYLESIVRFRDVVHSGAIGALTTLNADFYLGPHFGGFRDQMERVLLVDMAIHSFDQARFLAGADPISVYCHEWNPAGSWYQHGASAIAIFEMSDGLVFNYRGSWCAQGLPTAWACDWRAIGETGTARWDGEDQIRAERIANSEGFFRDVVAVDPGPAIELVQTGHAGVINEFIESVKGGTSPQTVCTDNIKSLAMVYAAIESAESGRKVQISYP